MKTILSILLLVSVAVNIYLFNNKENNNNQVGMVCVPNVSPAYESISFDELSASHTNYMSQFSNDPNATKAVWVSFEALQNYMCVVTQHARAIGQSDDQLGARIYFTKSVNQETKDAQNNIAFVPGNMTGGEPVDWPATVLRQSVPGASASFLMNRHRLCPVMCGKLTFN